VHTASIEELERQHEGEAARLLTSCTLKVVDVQMQPPRSREGMGTIGVTIVAPPAVGQYLQDARELQGRVRMAIDHSLGGNAYVARFDIQLDSASSSAA
jgi:hypothetical protein